MAVYEVSWNAFGVVEVEADTEEEAVEAAEHEVDYILAGTDYDGSDVGDYVNKIEDED